MKNISFNINFNNLKYNYLKIRKFTKLDNYCIPVIKGNGYGFGAINIVKTLLTLKNPQKNYFVFCLDEAIELRKHFLNKINNIYVLCGNLKNESKQFINYNITPVINSFYQLQDFCETLKLNNKQSKIVLQFNTGMNRNGFQIDEIDKIKKYIELNKNYINIEMILSHFACSNEIKHQMTQQQLKNIELLNKNFINIKRSFCATDAIFNLTDYIYECVRVGYGLYGGKIANYDKINLKQVLTITGKVYKYNDKYYYIKIGTNNGIFKHFNNKAYVLIENKKYYYKQILEDKIIIFSKDNINNKIALIVGKLNNDEIFINDYADFFNSNIQEMYGRLLKNINNINTNYKNCKSELKINNNIDYYVSEITEIRKVTENGWIGYDATKIVKEGDIIATIFNGYIDSLPRCLSNKYNVFIKIENDKIIKFKIYGKISMDQFTIKIPKKYKDKIKIGNKVIIVDIKNNINLKNYNLSKIEIEYMLKNIQRCIKL